MRSVNERHLQLQYLPVLLLIRHLSHTSYDVLGSFLPPVPFVLSCPLVASLSPTNTLNPRPVTRLQLPFPSAPLGFRAASSLVWTHRVAFFYFLGRECLEHGAFLVLLRILSSRLVPSARRSPTEVHSKKNLGRLCFQTHLSFRSASLSLSHTHTLGCVI